MDRINLNVPYRDKDAAKALGAYWDRRNKTWYITKSSDLELFRKWLPLNQKEILRSSLAPIMVVTSHSSCWRCKRESSVHCLASSGHITRSGQKSVFSLYSYLEEIDLDIYRFIKTHFPKYRPDYSKTTDSRYFINHCEHCDAKLGDFFLHEEHDCAFAPNWPEGAQGTEISVLNLRNEKYMILGSRYRPYPSHIMRLANRYTINWKPLYWLFSGKETGK